MNSKNKINSAFIFKSFASILIILCVIVFIIPTKYFRTETNILLVDNEKIISKNLETYRCGSKNQDTCANYVFTFSNKSLNVNRHTYYSNNINDNFSLSRTEESLTLFGSIILSIIVILGIASIFTCVYIALKDLDS